MSNPITPNTRPQEILNRLNESGLITGLNEVEILRTPGGQTVAGPLPSKVDEIVMAKVVSAGPNGEANYTDERYWLRRQEITIASTDEETARVTIADDDSPDGEMVGMDDDGGDLEGEPVAETILTATSMTEREAGSHTLAVGDQVVVFVVYGRHGTDGLSKRYVFWINEGDARKTIRITAAKTGIGWYEGYIVNPRIAKEWSPIVVDGVDTQTVYTNGDAFADGDYAKNLADSIVYHRESGAWVNAAGHATDTDVDFTEDLSDVADTFFVDDISQPVVVCDRYAARVRNQDAIVEALKAGDIVEGKLWYTQSDGTLIYEVDGGFRLLDGMDDGVVVQFIIEDDVGAWQIGYLQSHTVV
jgi:hypothetical protein